MSDNINLKIPQHILSTKSNSLDVSLLQDKIIVGFLGYARSGKDTLGSVLVDRYSFKRIAFGDILKQELNLHFKEAAMVDLKNKGTNINIEDIDFLNPKTQGIKETLRPYMIWLGEEVRRVASKYYWINKAFSEIGNNNKIIITDVRRDDEVDIFANTSFKSLLVHINQYGLSDADELTIRAIRKAQELWLFKHTIFVDSRIQNTGNLRQIHIENHINSLVEKFPEYFH